jgi:P-type E1-E2 ATPase
VTPGQKRDIVKTMKDSFGTITLAVGDGANDVSMILEAHVGVGIYGEEGMQAVQASDFAVGEFQYLQRLLLIHGRWNYIRQSEMIQYFFYKNLVFTVPQFFFTFLCAFSG